MLIKIPPMSNYTRQQRFQANNPGYDRRRKSRERESAKRGAAQLLAARLAMAASEAVATSKATEMIAFTPAIRVPTPRLALPAPVELPMLPSLNDIDALRAKLLARAA